MARTGRHLVPRRDFGSAATNVERDYRALRRLHFLWPRQGEGDGRCTPIGDSEARQAFGGGVSEPIYSARYLERLRQRARASSKSAYWDRADLRRYSAHQPLSTRCGPKRVCTFAAQKHSSSFAKPCYPLLYIAGHDLSARGSHGNSHPTARTYCCAWRCSRSVAICGGALPASGEAGSWLRSGQHGRCQRHLCSRVQQRPK